MVCPGCGTQLPDEAHYCYKCGLRQKGDEIGEETRYETCEIDWQPANQESILGKTFTFRATVDTPQGKLIVAETHELPTGTNGPFLECDDEIKYQWCVDALDNLVFSMFKGDWEFVERYDAGYWQFRFRRLITR